MQQIYAKLWRLETMKISKFLWSVLVPFAAVALIAPQQVEAIIIDGRVGGNVVLTGSGTISEGSGINSSRINGGSGINERSEEHTSELQSRRDLVCRLLLEKKK